MIVSDIPIRLIDVGGAIMMIVLSFWCLNDVRRLKQQDPTNIMWEFLMWICYGFALFAISRSVGHILKQVVLFFRQDNLWEAMRPFSGGINTMLFVTVASVILFFERIWGFYRLVLRDKRALQSAHKELVYLNQNLEQVVSERTQELTLSEHKYRRIFEVSKDMIVVLNTDGSIVDLNPQGLNLLGRGQANRGIDESRFQSYFADQKDWSRLKATLVKQGFISNAEVTLKRADGAAIRSLVSGSLDNGSEDNTGTIHLLVKDIEQKRLMEEQIAQADKLASIGQLSAGVAHEINNPLGVILGYTQLLMRDGDPNKERHDDLKIIEKHAKNCQSIVADLLSFSRSSRPEKEIKNVHDVIDDVLTFIQQHSGLDGVEIIRKYDQQLPSIVLDEKKIKQVFINLIMNAKHAVGKTGSIKLSSEFDPEAGQITVKVADTGHGIDKEHLPRIFDPFFTTKPIGEGTGLGLSVSYGIIKNHGGDIIAETRPHKGSTFTVVLPVVSGTKKIK
jgi:PAS domain S-box-containing protein